MPKPKTQDELLEDALTEPEIESAEETKDSEVVIDTEEEKDETKNKDGGATIDLDEETDEQFESKEWTPDKIRSLKKKHDSANGKLRITEKKIKDQEAEIQRLRAASTGAPATHQIPQQNLAVGPAGTQREFYNGTPVPQTEEEWDTLVKKDWKTAVDLRSIINARNVTQSRSQSEKHTVVLEDAKRKVLVRHPELSDVASEKSRVYMNILEQNPQYLTDPRGPIHAMRDMEEYMEETLGYKREEIVKARAAGAQEEADRRNRVVVSNTQGRTGGVDNPRQVTLTRDEVDFCKINGIDPKEYAKNKLKLSKTTGGIQV